MSRPAHFFPEIEWYGSPDDENVVVWNPAFGDSGTMTSRPYIPKLGLQGWTVMVPNHNQAGFNMADTVQNIYDELLRVKRQNVLLVGASFGMQCVAELIRISCRRAFDLSDKFSVVSVCGVSSGKDTNRPIWPVKYLPGPILPAAGAFFKYMQARDIERGTKSPFDRDDRDVAESIAPHEKFRKEHFSGLALIQQLKAMATTPPIEEAEFEGIPALVITTAGDDALLKPQAAKNLLAAFHPSYSWKVDLSIHCDLTELPSQYGPPLWDFARTIIETPCP